MSLEYVVDGYNAINHPLFSSFLKKNKDPRIALLELIKRKKLCGSLKNKVVLVFDGYPPSRLFTYSGAKAQILFSSDGSADEKIRKMLESSARPKDTVVVSDDREVKFYAKNAGAKALGIVEFMQVNKKSRPVRGKDLSKDELNYTQIDSINRELKKLWLK